jgi:hypothetical protein
MAVLLVYELVSAGFVSVETPDSKYSVGPEKD